MCLQQTLIVTHAAVRVSESQLATLLAETLRQRRHSKVWERRSVDETSAHVLGQWRSLDEAIERYGTLTDIRLSQTRDLAAVETFFR
jgi:transposase-like protein